jgi:5-formyltetrahydrofolate cyclo-ligase
MLSKITKQDECFVKWRLSLTMDILAQKKELRRQLFAKRNALIPEYKASYDAWVNEQLAILIAERKCKVVHAYIPMGSEIDITPLLQNLLEQNTQIIVPKTLPKRKLENRVLHSLLDLETGIMGTQHPAQPAIYEGPIDFIIVPGLAFDSQYYRLGYGGGYYDHFIIMQPNALKVGVFYPIQQVEKVPVEAHDVRFDRLLVKT